MPPASDPPSSAKSPKLLKTKKKLTNVPPPEPTLTPEQQLLFTQRQLTALQLTIDKLTLQRSNDELLIKDIRNQLTQSQETVSRKQKELDDITLDLTRQYKSMRSELLKKISDLEIQLQLNKDDLTSHIRQTEELKYSHHQQIQHKNAEINELQLKMREMSDEFAKMLKMTLDKMSEKIDVTQFQQQQKNQQTKLLSTARQHLHSNPLNINRQHSISSRNVTSNIASHSSKSILNDIINTSSSTDPIVKTFEEFSLVSPSFLHNSIDSPR